MTIMSGSLSDVVGDEIKRYIFPFFFSSFFCYSDFKCSRKLLFFGIFIININSIAEHFVVVNVVVYVLKPVTFTFAYVVRVISKKSSACSSCV